MVAKHHRGFSLIELLVTLAIMAILMAVGVPLTSAWADSAKVNDAKGKLTQAYSMAKAIAQRNPSGISLPSAAAGLSIVSGTLLVCTGNPVATTCTAGGSTVKWQATLPAQTTVSIGGGTTLGFDNTGVPLAGTNFSIAYRSQNETGNLY